MIINKKSLFSLIEFIYLLIPISLVFSIAIADFFLSLIVIFFIIHTLRYKIFVYYKNKIFIFFIIFCIYLVFVSLVKYQEVPLSVIFFFRFGIFSIATCYLLDRNKILLKYILISIFITCTFVAIDAIIQFIFGINILGYEYNLNSQPRLSGLFGDELILGSYLSRFAPLVFLQLGIIYTQLKNSKLSLIVLMVFLFLYTFVILASGERLSLVYFIISITIFLYLLNSKKIFFLTIILIVSSFLIISSDRDSRLFKTTYLQIEGTFNKTQDGNYRLKDFEKIPIAHIHHWKSATLMLKNNFIFGVGPTKFREKCKEPNYSVPNGCANHPHNIYFQLLSEAGVLGFLFVIVLFVLLSLKLAFKINKNKFFDLKNNYVVYNMSLLCIFLHLFPFLPNGNFFNNWLNIITFIPIGIYFHTSYNIRND